MPEGYTYGYPIGGEHVCEICGVPVRNTDIHTAWHNREDTSDD